MTPLIVAACGLCCGALFSVQTIPVEQPDAQCFFAEADGRGGVDLVVIDGHRLAVYPGAYAEETLSVQLDPECSAVDIDDIDGDGQPELIAVAGDRVLKYSMEPAASLRPIRKRIHARTSRIGNRAP